MNIMLLLIFLIPALLLLLTGLAIKYGKAYWLISGYNTMSKQEKEKVDIEGLAGLVAKAVFTMSAITVAAALFMAFNLMLVGTIIFLLIMPFSLYIVIKAQRYDGGRRNSDGSIKKKALLIGSVAFSVILIVGVGLLLYAGSRPAEYSMQEDALSIGGMYGETIYFSDMTGIALRKQGPEILYKSNGSALGDKKKGYFVLADKRKAKLFVDMQKSPFIYIETPSGLKILNTDDPEDTEQLYKQLLEAVGK